MKSNISNNTDAPFPVQIELFLQRQARLLKSIGADRSLDETLALLVGAIEAQSPNLFCAVLLIDSEDRSLRHGAAPSLPLDYVRAIDEVFAREGAGSGGTAAFRREKVCVADIATDPLWTNYRDLALRHELHTCWSKPILDGERRVLGTFAIYYRQPRLPQTSDLWLMEIATHMAGIAIGRHEDTETMREQQAQLCRWQDRMLEQEKRLRAVKSEVNGLLATQGQPARYAITSFP